MEFNAPARAPGVKRHRVTIASRPAILARRDAVESQSLRGFWMYCITMGPCAPASPRTQARASRHRLTWFGEHPGRKSIQELDEAVLSSSRHAIDWALLEPLDHLDLADVAGANRVH